MNCELEKMTAPEYARRVSEARGVILPLGSTEILGLHGPLGADSLVARAVAPEIARRADCLTAGVVPFGDALELSGFPATAHIPQRALEDYLYALSSSSLLAPAKAVIFLAFHSLNLRACDAVARRLRADGKKCVCVDWWKAVSMGAEGVLDDFIGGRGHGGEMITSVVLRVAPDAVRPSEAANEKPLEGLARFASRTFAGGDCAQTYGNFSDYCTCGAWGDVSKASAEKGEKLIEAAIARIAKTLADALSD